MELIIYSVMAILTFAWISGVNAGKGTVEPSPESIVTSQAGGPQMYMVVAMSLPPAINAEQCIELPESLPRECAPCVISLESQGCTTVEVVTGASNEFPIATYFFSDSIDIYNIQAV